MESDVVTMVVTRGLHCELSSTTRFARVSCWSLGSIAPSGSSSRHRIKEVARENSDFDLVRNLHTKEEKEIKHKLSNDTLQGIANLPRPGRQEVALRN